MIKIASHIILLLLLIFAVGCNQEFTLEGNGTNFDDEMTNDADVNSGDTGNTGGDTGDTGDTANSGDTADTGDAGNTGNTVDTADSGNTANTGDAGNTANTGDTSVDEIELPDTDMTDPSSFPDDFNLSQCECGEDPTHEPVCCNKTVAVYNLCFANCFAHYSNAEKMLCDEYVESACAPSENLFPDQDTLFDEDYVEDEDIISDEDVVDTPDDDSDEISDSDSAEDCGCYPDDFSAWCCNDGIIYISKCLADCHCSRNYILCPKQ